MSEERLVADRGLPRTDARNPSGQRRLVEVAVGVVLDGGGRFLMSSRPPGKIYAGYWEFPGGKLEAGESVGQALARELAEELGLSIDARSVHAWREQTVDYPHALVRLHWCRVARWQGPLRLREGQCAAWLRAPVPVGPILAGAIPVLEQLSAQ